VKVIESSRRCFLTPTSRAIQPLSNSQPVELEILASHSNQKQIVKSNSQLSCPQIAAVRRSKGPLFSSPSFSSTTSNSPPRRPSQYSAGCTPQVTTHDSQITAQLAEIHHRRLESTAYHLPPNASLQPVIDSNILTHKQLREYLPRLPLWHAPCITQVGINFPGGMTPGGGQ
jgi:hypothetical protein